VHDRLQTLIAGGEHGVTNTLFTDAWSGRRNHWVPNNSRTPRRAMHSALRPGINASGARSMDEYHAAVIQIDAVFHNGCVVASTYKLVPRRHYATSWTFA